MSVKIKFPEGFCIDDNFSFELFLNGREGREGLAGYFETANDAK